MTPINVAVAAVPDATALRENIAQCVIAGVLGIAIKLSDLEQDIRLLWEAFDNLPVGETILGCTTKREFCNLPAPTEPIVSNREKVRRVFRVEHPEHSGCTNKQLDSLIHKAQFHLPHVPDEPTDFSHPSKEGEERALEGYLSEQLRLLINRTLPRFYENGYMVGKAAIYKDSHPTDLYYRENARRNFLEKLRLIIDHELAEPEPQLPLRSVPAARVTPVSRVGRRNGGAL